MANLRQSLQMAIGLNKQDTIEKENVSGFDRVLEELIKQIKENERCRLSMNQWKSKYEKIINDKRPKMNEKGKESEQDSPRNLMMKNDDSNNVRKRGQIINLLKPENRESIHAEKRKQRKERFSNMINYKQNSQVPLFPEFDQDDKHTRILQKVKDLLSDIKQLETENISQETKNTIAFENLTISLNKFMKEFDNKNQDIKIFDGNNLNKVISSQVKEINGIQSFSIRDNVRKNEDEFSFGSENQINSNQNKGTLQQNTIITSNKQHQNQYQQRELKYQFMSLINQLKQSKNKKYQHYQQKNKQYQQSSHPCHQFQRNNLKKQTNQPKHYYQNQQNHQYRSIKTKLLVKKQDHYYQKAFQQYPPRNKRELSSNQRSMQYEDY